MQKIARETGISWRAVQAIANHRVSNAREMDPDLVRAAGSDFHLEVAESAGGLLRRWTASKDPIFRQCRSALVQLRRHPDAPHGVTGDWRGNTSGILLDLPVYRS